jgi:hypothetical protein
MSARSVIYSGTEWLVTATATAYDLITSRPAYDPAAGNNARMLPRQIVCLDVTAGTNVDVTDINGNASSITMSAGMALDIQAATIVNTTTPLLLIVW